MQNGIKTRWDENDWPKHQQNTTIHEKEVAVYNRIRMLTLTNRLINIVY